MAAIGCGAWIWSLGHLRWTFAGRTGQTPFKTRGEQEVIGVVRSVPERVLTYNLGSASDRD